jgi:transposase
MRQQKPMKNWTEQNYFAGFDWASDHHDVVIVDRAGQVLAQFRFSHDADGWELFRDKIKAFAELAVAIETSCGAAVEQLLQSGCTVYPVHGRSAKAYRQRKAPSGAKNDLLDAWSLAEALRVDGQQWKALTVQDPHLQELRLLCRDEVSLIEQRTALILQLEQALAEYFPVALEAFDDWTTESSWDFIQTFPTAQALSKAGKRRWEKFLHTHRLARPQTYENRLSLFAKAEEFCGSEAISRAKSRLALALVATLKTVQKQLREYRQAIEELFEKHPDKDLFGSLPGTGPKLAPRLLSELGSDRSVFENPQSLQCLAGTAPVSFQSGQILKVYIRRHCNKHLRAAIHLWANLSRSHVPWAQQYYQAHRDKGQSHACALRCLGQRWLKILWKMWQTRSAYDPDLHARNQQKHGSWLLTLNAKPA